MVMLLLILIGLIAVAGGFICVHGAGVWRQRARWLAEAPLTPIAAAREGKVIRVVGQVLPSGGVGPISGRAAAIWRIDLFEFMGSEGARAADSSHDIRFSEEALAIADGSGATAMLNASSAHLLLIEQRDVARLSARGRPTSQVEALCQRLGLALHGDPRRWRVEAQERIVAPGTSVHAIGQVQVDGETVWLKPPKDTPESCFATQDPRGFSAQHRTLMLFGAALFVTGVALILLGGVIGFEDEDPRAGLSLARSVEEPLPGHSRGGAEHRPL
ncbi:hypothetical protein [Hyalangium gracile]|uniref:hypothetical protein n=1 Tax=Hyalangium gracile TaxID=394092 RepID=UPI001CCAB73D|nr:hypothetical protein [Hyalangium gracile]